MTDAQQRAAAKAFAKNWKDRGYEKGDSQIFWVELLTTVFDVTEISPEAVCTISDFVFLSNQFPQFRSAYFKGMMFFLIAGDHFNKALVRNLAPILSS